MAKQSAGVRYYRGVRYVAKGRKAPTYFKAPATCGHCERTWDDGHSSVLTPAPSGRCPFEYMHRYPREKPARKDLAYRITREDTEEYAGRKLTETEFERICKALDGSTLSDVVGDVVASVMIDDEDGEGDDGDGMGPIDECDECGSLGSQACAPDCQTQRQPDEDAGTPRARLDADGTAKPLTEIRGTITVDGQCKRLDGSDCDSYTVHTIPAK